LDSAAAIRALEHLRQALQQQAEMAQTSCQTLPEGDCAFFPSHFPKSF
jgi:hypothetical protein